MAFTFPASPATNDTYTVGSRTYTWTGSVWEMTGGLITTSQLTDLGVTTAKIDNLSVTAGKIASDAVTTAKILDANVTAGKIASGAAVTNIGYTPANIASPTFTGTVVLPATTSIGTVSNTEIGYVDGVTSAIQTQLDSKLTATTAVTSNRNAIINGNMSTWQRGTSIATSAANVYLSDRWATSAAASASTISRQSTNDTTNLPFIQYCMRFQRNSGQTSTTAYGIYQALETVNTIPFVGKTVTLSFYARAGANYSPTSSLLGVQLFAGTGTDQNPYSGGYTGQTIPINTTQAITTTWARYSQTVAIGATITEVASTFYMTPTGTAGTNDYFEITGVQLEVGSVATPFEFEDICTTLAKCQRYFQTTTDAVCAGLGSGTTEARFTLPLPVTLRASPTTTLAAGTSYAWRHNGAVASTSTSITVLGFFNSYITFNLPGFSGMSDGYAVNVSINGRQLSLSSEL